MTKANLFKRKKKNMNLPQYSFTIAHFSHHLNVCDLIFTDVLSQDDIRP